MKSVHKNKALARLFSTNRRIEIIMGFVLLGSFSWFVDLLYTIANCRLANAQCENLSGWFEAFVTVIFIMVAGGVWLYVRMAKDKLRLTAKSTPRWSAKGMVLFLSPDNHLEDFPSHIGLGKFKNSQSKHNWVQPMRGIEKHIASVEQIAIIHTDTTTAETFKEHLENAWERSSCDRKLPDILLYPKSEERALDPNSIEDCFNAVNKCIDWLVTAGTNRKQCVIDITGGRKPASVAGASISFEQDLHCQYVTATGEPHIFNLSLRDYEEQ